jgi:transcription-repair coupling factor (superfamily II helicase)
MPDLCSLLQPLLNHAALRAARAALEANTPQTHAAEPVTLSGLTVSGKATVVAALASQVQRPIVVLTRDNETAQAYSQTTTTFLNWLEPAAGDAVCVLPALDCSPYDGRSPHAEIQEQRAVTLWNLAHRGARVVFTPLAAALGRFREPAFYSSLALEIKVGDELSLEDLTEHLHGVGYEPAEPVTTVGDYSVRGGIVDVFPPEAEWPFRLEFFGDQLESVREFDPSSQRSRQPTPKALLLPLSEAPRSPRLFANLVHVLTERSREHAKSRGVALPDREPEWAAEHSNVFPGWEFFVPTVEPHRHTLISLLDRPVLVWDEFPDRRNQIQSALESLAASYDEVRDIVPPRPEPQEIYLTEPEFLHALARVPQISLRELALEGALPAAAPVPSAVVIGGDLYFAPTDSVKTEIVESTPRQQNEPPNGTPQSPAPSTQYPLLCQPPP